MIYSVYFSNSSNIGLTREALSWRAFCLVVPAKSVTVAESGRSFC